MGTYCGGLKLENASGTPSRFSSRDIIVDVPKTWVRNSFFANQQYRVCTNYEEGMYRMEKIQVGWDGTQRRVR